MVVHCITKIEFCLTCELPGADLLKRMLTFDPRKRITVEEALSHHWFADLGSPPPPTSPAIAIFDSEDVESAEDENEIRGTLVFFNLVPLLPFSFFRFPRISADWGLFCCMLLCGDTVCVSQKEILWRQIESYARE